jgi:hypothetical protein
MKNAKRKAQSAKRTNIKARIAFVGMIFTLYALTALALCADAKPISSAELINNAKSYDVKIVSYAGEVIGDIMVRGDYAWINVHDGEAAIGVWLPAALIKGIKHTGGYRLRGDWVEVSGIFENTCPQHGGDLDIHAKSLKIIKQGFVKAETIDQAKVKTAIILFIVCFLVIVVYFIRIAYLKRT